MNLLLKYYYLNEGKKKEKDSESVLWHQGFKDPKYEDEFGNDYSFIYKGKKYNRGEMPDEKAEDIMGNISRHGAQGRTIYKKDDHMYDADSMKERNNKIILSMTPKEREQGVGSREVPILFSINKNVSPEEFEKELRNSIKATKRKMTFTDDQIKTMVNNYKKAQNKNIIKKGLDKWDDTAMNATDKLHKHSVNDRKSKTFKGIKYGVPALAAAGTAYGAYKINQMVQRKKTAKSCYQSARGDKNKFKQCLMQSRKFKPTTKDSTIEKYYYKAKNN